MCKKTECIVCYKESFMTPCGANNTCKVYVCMDCKVENDYTNDDNDGAMDNGIYNCIICKDKEYKNGIYFELYDLKENHYGITDDPKPVIEKYLFNE